MKNIIFDGLEKFGLSSVVEKSQVIFEESSNDKQRPGQKKKAAEFNIDDYIYEKKFTCPVCEKKFMATIVRDSKVRLLSIEYDLRPIYTPVEPLFYDIVVCDTCGYTAVKNFFSKITNRQSDLIRSEISPNFKPVPYPKVPKIDMAIERYKLALLCTVVKQGSNGEKAYLCMKLTWLHRIKGNDAKNEKKFAALAIQGFASALLEERLPIMGMEESTILYVIAAFSKFVGDNRNALKILSKVLTSRRSSDKIKDRARSLREEIAAAKPAE